MHYIFKTKQERSQIITQLRKTGSIPEIILDHLPTVKHLILTMTNFNADSRPSSLELLNWINQNGFFQETMSRFSGPLAQFIQSGSLAKNGPKNEANIPEIISNETSEASVQSISPQNQVISYQEREGFALPEIDTKAVLSKTSGMSKSWSSFASFDRHFLPNQSTGTREKLEITKYQDYQEAVRNYAAVQNPQHLEMISDEESEDLDQNAPPEKLLEKISRLKSRVKTQSQIIETQRKKMDQGNSFEEESFENALYKYSK